MRASNGSYEFIDFRETAPAVAFEEMYKDSLDASLYGGLARFSTCIRTQKHPCANVYIVECQENYEA